ncbi:DEAD/DEAH box helicase [Fibrivirga algicola]|uniref:RNA helicase n=1 Tax=Fibrivirga algicola TaxID=2950420 RepID=A0ABX0QJY2_9BACT|nr:DEAD/DEAH box helicase [Fibrivirga algicola]NID11158.1 DEAD/DEAH box helicase [Fibrivirga algicola]
MNLDNIQPETDEIVDQTPVQEEAAQTNNQQMDANAAFQAAVSDVELPANEVEQPIIKETITVQPVVAKGFTFADLNVSADILAAVTEMGFTTPSPIQAEAIPPILAGRDVIGQAQTGTGKTAAFGIPALELIDPSDRSVQVLILCPTRELAVQVTDELRKLSKFKRGIYIETIYGGDSIERQIRSLKKGVHIVVGTPGRVMDHMQRNTLKLDDAKMIILDEADEMLDMGFREDIESILEDFPEERQTVLFSATMSKPILAMTQRFQVNPVMVKVVKKELTNVNIEQVYFEVKPKAKTEVMCRLIDLYDLKLMLVFCNTKRKVEEIVEDMMIRGYQAEGLHGDLRQAQRSNVMSKFRAGTTTILVATDVAARGIDVDNVDAVINYDIPLDEEYYVHRIGRTGRAGKSGRAFSLVSRDEKFRFRDIQTYTKVRVDKGVIPSFEDIVGIRKARFIEQLEVDITESKDLHLYDDMLTQLQHTGFSTEQIVAALMKRSMGIEKNEFSDKDLNEEDRRNGNSSNRFEDRGPREGGRGRFDDRRNDSRGGGRFEDRRGGDRGGRFESRGTDSRGGGRFEDRRGGGRFEDRGPRPEREGGKEGYFARSNERPVREREPNMTRLSVSIGRRDYVRPGDLVGAIAGESGIPGSSIGSIDIFDKHTFVDVPNDVANRVVQAMDGNNIKGRQVNVEIAK